MMNIEGMKGIAPALTLRACSSIRKVGVEEADEGKRYCSGD